MSTVDQRVEGGLAAALPRPAASPRARLAALGESAFVLPLAALIGVVILLPALVALVNSFTDWQPGYDSPWVGTENYTALLDSKSFGQILRNQAFLLLGVPIWTLLPLVISVLLYERVPAAGLFRTIFFLPSIVSPAIVAILFREILADDGTLNRMLGSVGLDALAQPWLQDPQLVKPVIMVLLAWSGLGVGVIIFSAALSSVNPELFEAAEMDGASWWQRFRNVVMPQISSVIALYAIYQIIFVFLGTFGWIYVLTQGGPGYSSTTIDYDVYQKTIAYGHFGEGAAEAVVLLAIVLLVVFAGFLVQRWFQRREGLAGDISRVTIARREAGRRVRLAVRSMTAPLPRLSRASRRSSWSPLRTLIAVLLAIPFLYPFVFMALTAARTTEDYVAAPTGWPKDWTLDFFGEAWTRADLGDAMINSVIAVGVGVLVCVGVSLAGAFWFLRHRGRWATVLLGMIGGVWVVPFVVYIIPMFTFVSSMGLADNLIVLGVIYAAANAPFALYLISSFLRSGLPLELLEAAEVDGASLRSQFLRIVVPLARPAIGTAVALGFLFMWGDLLFAVVLMNDVKDMPVTAAASTLVGRYELPVQLNTAGALLAVLPVLAVFGFAQRAIVRGFTSGIGK